MSIFKRKNRFPCLYHDTDQIDDRDRYKKIREYTKAIFPCYKSIERWIDYKCLRCGKIVSVER